LQPKEYGIARILGSEKESSGGKKNKDKIKNYKKKYVSNKIKQNVQKKI
jgi:hypothetical protein